MAYEKTTVGIFSYTSLSSLRLEGPNSRFDSRRPAAIATGGEQVLPLAIADSIDAGNVCVLIFVDSDIPLLVDVDTNFFQTDVFRQRVAANRPEQCIDLDLLAFIRVHSERLALSAFNLHYFRLLVDVHARFPPSKASACPARQDQKCVKHSRDE